MINTKVPSHQSELRKAIKKLTNDLHEFSEERGDALADNAESVAGYVCKLNEEKLNRSFLDYCIAARRYVNLK
ncbi:MAG: hypothetical protein RLN88_12525 [Ekhidna sp.]|uniref:hypothetical protein n=1 Tax=Ekhidna sp. TaxID=2608089 RepID=UPI0032EC78FC